MLSCKLDKVFETYEMDNRGYLGSACIEERDDDY